MENTAPRTEYRRRKYPRQAKEEKESFFITLIRQIIVCLILTAAIYIASLYNMQFKTFIKNTLDYTIDFKASVSEITEVIKNVYTKTNENGQT